MCYSCARDVVQLTDILEGRLEGKLNSRNPIIPQAVA